MPKLLLSTLIILTAAATPRWTTLQSGVKVRLRGISAVSDKVVWASGSNSTVLRSIDGGFAWQTFAVATDEVDFRDIDAIDENTVYVLSIGNGGASRIYKTTNAGVIWQLQYKNQDPRAFYDAMSFWDASHGMVIGDSIDGQFCIMTTTNGRDWNRVPVSALPRALENEGAFAASGSNVALFGKTHAWIATGGAAKSRVLHTADGGQTWRIAETPIKAGQSSGIFSIAFRDAQHGIVVGGDYKEEKAAVDNAAITINGGVTWTLVKGLSGYRSAVAYVPGTKWVVAVGPSGADFSEDDGQNWKPIAGPGFDTLSFIPSLRKDAAVAFGAGANGTMAKLEFGK
ncbi:MAG TPA: hypothetical protein VLA93_19935 [Pyrinomonadaceae bacterium]|nr:hypothetical protein [Pyrinomonadaceae bacterium]